MPILYLFFYILFGVLFVLNALAKWLAKGTQCVNPYIRNSIKVMMWLTIISSIFYSLYTYQKRDIISFDKLMVKPTIEECQSFIDDYPNSEKYQK